MQLIKLILIFLLMHFTFSCKNFVEKNFEEAKDFELQEKYAEAIKVYDSILMFNPVCEKAYFERGVDKGIIGDFKGAIFDMEYVISKKPFSIEPYVIIAEYLRTLSRYEEALNFLKKALENKKGVIYNDGVPISVVEYDYTNPNIENENYDIELEYILFERAMCYINLVRYQDALNDLDYCIMNRDLPDIDLLERGNLLINIGENVKGCRDLEKSMLLDNYYAKKLYQENCL